MVVRETAGEKSNDPLPTLAAHILDQLPIRFGRVLKPNKTSRILHGMKTPGPVLAFDRQSVRSVDADGRLHVALTNISKANVSPYYGSEIPGFASLGLDPGKVYNLWRDPSELEKGAKSFNNLPILRRHIQVSADAPSKEDVVGSIGSDVTFNSPYLCASLCFWDSEAIAGIESGQLEELSPAYRYTPDMTPGETPDGESYDGRMTNILGNHLATVEVGRTGKDVVVADSTPFTNKQETPAMKTKLGRALIAALSAASPKIAQDSSLGALVGEAKKKTFKKTEVVAALVAMDSEIDTGSLDEIIDAILGVQENPEPEKPAALAGDEPADGGAAQLMAFLQQKGLSPEDLEAVSGMVSKLGAPAAAVDADPEADVMTKEDVDTAMDSMRKDLTKQFRDLEQAKADVRPTVGDVIGMDSAPSVYRFALDQMKVDHKDLPDAALGKFYALAADRKSDKSPATLIANDSATVATIKGLDRFS